MNTQSVELTESELAALEDVLEDANGYGLSSAGLSALAKITLALKAFEV